MRKFSLELVLMLLVCGVLAGCTSAPELTPTQRDDMFWENYEKRVGLVGTDYADPADAKAANIRFGHVVCRELANGTDRNVLVAKLTNAETSAAKAKVTVDTAVEFLCPEYR